MPEWPNGPGLGRSEASCFWRVRNLQVFNTSDVCYSSRDDMVTGDQVENPWWLSASAGSNPALRIFFLFLTNFVSRRRKKLMKDAFCNFF